MDVRMLHQSLSGVTSSLVLVLQSVGSDSSYSGALDVVFGCCDMWSDWLFPLIPFRDLVAKLHC
jgi:hypothetical protein